MLLLTPGLRSAFSSARLRPMPHRYPPGSPSRAYHAVAGNGERHRVGGAGAGHRTGGARVAHRRGNLGIRARFAARNPPQFLPDPALEGGGADVQRDFRRLAIARCEARHTAGVPGGHAIVRADRGAGELGAKLLLQLRRGVAEANGAYAARGGRHQDLTRRGRHHRESDLQPRAAVAVCRRGHAQLGRAPLVEAAAGAVAGVVERPRYRRPALHLPLKALQPAPFRPRARRNPQHCLERALDVKRAIGQGAGQPGQRNVLLRVGFDIPADLPHHLHRRIDRGALGPAAQAWPESGALGFLPAREEQHVLAPRPPRAAGRPAVDPGRDHAVPHGPVHGRLALRYRLPVAGLPEILFRVHGAPHFDYCRSGCHDSSLRPHAARRYPVLAPEPAAEGAHGYNRSMESVSRRTFVGGAAATFAAGSYARVMGANERLRIGVIGCGGMAKGHMRSLNTMKESDNLEIVAVCDVYDKRAESAAELTGGRIVKDYRAPARQQGYRLRPHRHAGTLARADDARRARRRQARLLREAHDPHGGAVAQGGGQGQADRAQDAGGRAGHCPTIPTKRPGSMSKTACSATW